MFVHPRHYNKRVFPHLSRARSHENDGNTFLLHPAQFYGCVYKDKQAVRSCNNGVPQNGCAQSVHHQRASSREWKGGPQYPPPQRCHCRHVQSLTAPAWRGISILPLKCRLVPPPPWKVDQLLLSANPCFTNCCPRADTILVFLGGGWRLISFSFPFLHSSMHCYTNRDTDPYL